MDLGLPATDAVSVARTSPVSLSQEATTMYRQAAEATSSCQRSGVLGAIVVHGLLEADKVPAGACIKGSTKTDVAN